MSKEDACIFCGELMEEATFEGEPVKRHCSFTCGSLDALCDQVGMTERQKKAVRERFK